jgi:hypothetical protein
LPFTIQIIPVFALGIGLYKLPYSPRWLVQVGRDADALQSLCDLRVLSKDDPRIQAEWITIRAEAIRSREVVVLKHPSLQGGSFGSELKLEIIAWADMFSPAIIKRTMVGVMLMIFQQFQGINAVSMTILMQISEFIADSRSSFTIHRLCLASLVSIPKCKSPCLVSLM